MEKKYLPAIVNKLKIKRTKKVKVADIKKYLVDEYKLTDNLNKENKDLRKKLDEADILKQKYDLALVTLDEYKKRLDDKDKEIKDISNTKEIIKNQYEKVCEERNNLKIQYREYEIKIADINKEIEKESKKRIQTFKKSLIEDIKNSRGSWSKVKIVDLINNCKFKEEDEE